MCVCVCDGCVCEGAGCGVVVLGGGVLGVVCVRGVCMSGGMWGEGVHGCVFISQCIYTVCIDYEHERKPGGLSKTRKSQAHRSPNAKALNLRPNQKRKSASTKGAARQRESASAQAQKTACLVLLTRIGLGQNSEPGPPVPFNSEMASFSQLSTRVFRRLLRKLLN